ncbi:DNA-directed RNA polymerase subunit alpha C-terminal domain-containing protein [Lachnobacterium bovis]|uniref:DNA-directed RNA polymerase subunit alpha C-terminal domain-containing protein n=1 Tax=Lachnobacterium bovis TaxID=140626 RepID=UPI00048BA514|nr:DNA-directed RNA polymerase subunit alpha C-terminal domain-containing protein [Lachnobacterium bovis]
MENISIDKFGFSTRTRNSLYRGKIDTLDKIMMLSEDDLFHIRNMGAKSVSEVLDFQKQYIDKTWELKEDEVLLTDIDVKNPMFIQSAFPESLGREIECIEYRNPMGEYYPDLRVDVLGFSNRTENALLKAGYTTINQVAMSLYDEIKGIRNMGAKSIAELLDYLKDNSEISYIGERLDESIDGIFTYICNRIDIDNQNARNKLCRLFKRLVYEHRSEIKELLVELDLASVIDSEWFATLVIETDEIRKVYKSFVLIDISHSNFYDYRPENDLLYDIGLYRKIISELLADNKIEYVDGYYQVRLPRVREWIESIENEKQHMAVDMRIQGKTLEECGQVMGLTRERVRQIVSKAMSKKPLLREDGYSYWFKKYALDKEAFLAIFCDDISTYEYLHIVYNHGDKNIEELLDDEKITRDIYIAANRYNNRNNVLVGDEYVPCKREAICKKIAEINCADKDVSYDDFYELYMQFLCKCGLDTNTKMLYPSSRAFAARVEESMYILNKYGRKLRYYPVDEIDIETFVEKLQLEQFVDVEISTLKLLHENTELMKEFDIRDEYELHNLLKKTADKWNPDNKYNVSINRMPFLVFGEASRQKQTEELLMQIAPVSIEDYCMFYEIEYGVLARTVMANFTPFISNYYHHGVYTINQPLLSDAEEEYMKTYLCNDFYFVEDIKKAFIREFKDSDVKKINPRTLKGLGFSVYTNYVIDMKYSSAYEYFKDYLTRKDTINLREQDNRLTCIHIENSTLEELRSSYELLEYEDMKFLKLSRLQSVYPDITKDTIYQYVNQALSFANGEKYFTIKRLKEKGFSHRLHDVSLPEWFTAALIKNSRRVRFVKSGDGIIFYQGNHQITTGDFLKYVMKERKSIDIYELVNYLEEKYGLIYMKDKVIQFIKPTSVYYDSIMEKVYLTKEYYYEEI